MENISYKIILIGDSGVGKTTIAHRFYSGYFYPAIETTIGAAYFQKNIILDNNTFKLHIWDTAGQERYHSLVKIYYRNSHAAIFVFDLTNRDSFLNMNMWINYYFAENDNPNSKIIIVGNKSDIPNNKWRVTIREIEVLAKKHECPFFLTSCVSGINITELFEILTRSIPKINTEIETDDLINISNKENKTSIFSTLSYNKCC